VPLRQLRDEVPVLHDEGLVEAVLTIHQRDHLGGGLKGPSATGDREGRVSRQQVQSKEAQRRGTPQHKY
jgi:hypothetical protein